MSVWFEQNNEAGGFSDSRRGTLINTLARRATRRGTKSDKLNEEKNEE